MNMARLTNQQIDEDRLYPEDVWTSADMVYLFLSSTTDKTAKNNFIIWFTKIAKK